MKDIIIAIGKVLEFSGTADVAKIQRELYNARKVRCSAEEIEGVCDIMIDAGFIEILSANPHSPTVYRRFYSDKDKRVIRGKIGR